jgi:two-component system LytT family response regulator
MIKVLAIDDEPLALKQLVAYINKIPFFQLVGQCRSALEAQRLMENEVVDALFCDINMPDLSGMDFVRQLAVRPLIVFTTAYSEYAIEGYKVDAVDYLLKPFGLNDFQRAAEKVRQQWELRHKASVAAADTVQSPSLSVANGHPSETSVDSDTIFVKTEYRVVRIAIADIRYVEGMSEYLRIYLTTQPKPIIVLLSMKKLEERLPSFFMRIHRSYIVNLHKIQEVNKNRVILEPAAHPDGHKPEESVYLPIGDLYKDKFNDYLNSNFLGK